MAQSECVIALYYNSLHNPCPNLQRWKSKMQDLWIVVIPLAGHFSLWGQCGPSQTLLSGVPLSPGVIIPDEHARVAIPWQLSSHR